VGEDVHDAERRRAEQHDEQGWQNKDDHRHGQQRWEPRRLFLRPRHPRGPHLGGEHPQRLSERGPEFGGLLQGIDDRPDAIRVGACIQIVERLTAVGQESQFRGRDGELFGEFGRSVGEFS